MKSTTLVILVGLFVLLQITTTQSGRKRSRACTCLECIRICNKRKPKIKPCLCKKCKITCPKTAIKCDCKCKKGCDCEGIQANVSSKAHFTRTGSTSTATAVKLSSQVYAMASAASRQAANASSIARKARELVKKVSAAAGAFHTILARHFYSPNCSTIEMLTESCTCMRLAANASSTAASVSDKSFAAAMDAAMCADLAGEAALIAKNCAAKSALNANNYKQQVISFKIDCQQNKAKVKSHTKVSTDDNKACAVNKINELLQTAKLYVHRAEAAKEQAKKYAKALKGADEKTWNCAKRIAIMAASCKK